MAYNYNQNAGFQGGTFDQGSAPSRTLWMGELDAWMDESYLRQLFWSLGEEVTCRVSVDKYGGAYAFIEFQTHEGANKLLQSVNGTLIPNTSKYFRLNWSSRDGNGNPMPTNVVNNNWNNGFCIFVGDLGSEVDDTLLMQGFLRYPSVRSAKVMMDTITGNSRGFGFVKFLNETDQLSAIDEMQNVYIGSRPVRISMARPRNRFEITNNVPENEITTVFVGCLNNTITEEELRAFFGTCGEILAIKMITAKNIAFIQYERRSSAEKAIAELNGAHLGGAKLRLSFGRTQLNTGLGGYHYAPPQMPAYTNSSPMQPAYQPPQPQAPVQMPQPVIPPPDFVEPQLSVPVNTQNDQFLASQENNCIQWISATTFSGY